MQRSKMRRLGLVMLLCLLGTSVYGQGIGDEYAMPTTLAQCQADIRALLDIVQMNEQIRALDDKAKARQKRTIERLDAALDEQIDTVMPYCLELKDQLAVCQAGAR